MSNSKRVKIRFLVKSWDGLRNKTTEPREFEMTMSQGDKLNADSFGGFIGSGLVKNVSFELVEISNGGVKINTSGLVERNSGGTINLMKNSHELNFSIDLGKALDLVTQSMDAGFSIKVMPLGLE